MVGLWKQATRYRAASQALHLYQILITLGFFGAACQTLETREDTQDDTLLEVTGGTQANNPSEQPAARGEGGNGGSAGASSDPIEEPIEEPINELPCEIVEIFTEYCFKCHADRIEPRLDLFETARAAAPQIRGALVGTGPREMPPRESLPALKRQQVVDWIKAGTPPAPPDASCP